MYLALYLPKSVRDPEEESLVRLVLGTLKPSLPLLKTPRDFLQQVLDFLQRRYPEERVSFGKEMTVLFGKAVVDMEQAWKEYQNAPELFEEIALARRPAEPQLSGGKLPSELTWEMSRSRIMPMLLPGAEVSQWHPGLVFNDWIAGLKRSPTFSTSRSRIATSTFRCSSAWGVSLEQIHEQATENLEGYFRTKPMEIAASQNLDATQVFCCR